MLPTSFNPIVGLGEVVWDLLPAGPRLGGAPTNFSILSARLGNPVALVSRLGRDELGATSLAQLQAIASLDITHLQHSEGLPTGTVSVTLDEEGRPQYEINAPAAWDELAETDDLQALAGQAAAVCYGSLAQRNATTAKTLRGFVEATCPACVRVCDVNLRRPFYSKDILLWSLQHATVLKVSDEELPTLAEIVHGGPLSTPLEGLTGEALTAAATQIARSLLAFAPQCQLVAITLGPHGSLLATRAEVHRHAGFSIRVADTIGAGDAFTAGLTHAYLRGASLANISQIANMCGSYVASQRGATPELPAELLASIQAVLG
jgi:fructokinase